MHSFVTAKFWGKGPQHWTAGLVSEITLGAPAFGSPLAFFSPSGLISAPSPRSCDIPQPTSLCQWTIHYGEEPGLQYDVEPDRPIQIQADFDLNDRSSWTPWPPHETQNRTLQGTMEESLAHCHFSTTPSDEIPLSSDLVAEAVSKSPEELKLDSVAFAIMSGNLMSVTKTIKTSSHMDFKAIRPYHLAASFLDGGHTCCLVMNDLLCLLEYKHPIALNNVNDDGHTVLDSLMISILRSHTNLAPADVSSSFNDRKRFPGEEKDICGRWDADTPAVRQLYQAGHHRIPQHWKHNFCHSAVQAVCHSMLSIFAPSSAPNINAHSGLFRRRCTHCGLEMKLGPFHVIVMVAFYLAERGMDGETLFGAVACAVCLLVLGGDAALATDLSDDWLMFLTSTEGEGCRHRPITATQLAEKVPQSLIDRWNSSCKTGWKCLYLILQRTAAGIPQRPELLKEHACRVLNDKIAGRFFEEDREEIEDIEGCQDYPPCSLGDGHWDFNLPCIPYFGVLWASIQTELLTYRKITSLDPSISTNFRMGSLRQWLEGETHDFQTPLVDDKMMRPHWECGWFDSDESLFVCKASDVSSHYFMNLDIWERATFIEGLVPEGCGFV